MKILALLILLVLQTPLIALAEDRAVKLTELSPAQEACYSEAKSRLEAVDCTKLYLGMRHEMILFMNRGHQIIDPCSLADGYPLKLVSDQQVYINSVKKYCSEAFKKENLNSEDLNYLRTYYLNVHNFAAAGLLILVVFSLFLIDQLFKRFKSRRT